MRFFLALFVASFGAQQSTKPPDPKPPAEAKPEQGKQVEEPPEEDESLVKSGYKDCVLNPLEADRNITAGNFYFKKSNYGAAVNRHRAAACWDPSSAESFLKLGEAYEKLRNRDAEREAYEKYLALAPQAKNAPDIKKKLAKLPPKS